MTEEWREDGDRLARAEITARDYFAAAAVQGMLACPIQPQSGPEMYARDAYVLADAMLVERSKD